MVHGLQQACVSPGIKISLHSREWRKITRQHPPLAPPLASTGGDIQNGIYHLTHFCAPGTAARFGWWDKWLQQLPFPVRQIALVMQAFAVILATSDIIPRHVILHGVNKHGVNKQN
jgi:hypothetical protein